MTLSERFAEKKQALLRTFLASKNYPFLDILCITFKNKEKLKDLHFFKAQH